MQGVRRAFQLSFENATASRETPDAHLFTTPPPPIHRHSFHLHPGTWIASLVSCGAPPTTFIAPPHRRNNTYELLTPAQTAHIHADHSSSLAHDKRNHHPHHQRNGRPGHIRRRRPAHLRGYVLPSAPPLIVFVSLPANSLPANSLPPTCCHMPGMTYALLACCCLWDLDMTLTCTTNTDISHHRRPRLPSPRPLPLPRPRPRWRRPRPR